MTIRPQINREGMGRQMLPNVNHNVESPIGFNQFTHSVGINYDWDNWHRYVEREGKAEALMLHDDWFALWLDYACPYQGEHVVDDPEPASSMAEDRDSAT